MKKAFTPKMKPRIDWIYCDADWLEDISVEKLREIEKYFDEHPDFKARFDKAEPKLNPGIVNCYIDLPEKRKEEF